MDRLQGIEAFVRVAQTYSCAEAAGHDMPTFWLSAVYPAAQHRQLKLKLFPESLAASRGDDPPWDKPLIARGLIARPCGLRGPGAACVPSGRS
jgi:hypothetical protein